MIGPMLGLMLTIGPIEGLGLGLTMGLRLGLKLTIGPRLGPTLGRILMMGPRLGLIEAPELGFAVGVTVGVSAPVEGVGVLPVLPDGELLAWAVAVPVTVPSMVAEGVSDAVAESVGWAVFWGSPFTSVVAFGLDVGLAVAWDVKIPLRSVHPDIINTANSITDINAIDLFDNTMIMHLKLKP